MIFLISLLYVCIFVYVSIYLCHLSWPNEKRYRPEIWHTYSHWPYLKTCFFVFSIKSPWRPLASKNCRVTWIFRISPRSPCLFIFIYWIIFRLQHAFCFIYFLFEYNNSQDHLEEYSRDFFVIIGIKKFNDLIILTI